MTLGPHDLGPHAGFILGAYVFTALVIAGLIGHAIRDRRAQTRALAALQDSSQPVSRSASRSSAERRA